MRVLLVRPAEQAASAAAELVRRGHVPVEAPVLAIVPSGLPPPEGDVDALLVTSRNAAAALARHRERLGALPVFAVGPRTAAACEAAGFTPVAASAGTAASLAATVAAALPPGARLLHVAGRDRRDEPVCSLVRQGYRVATWEAYAAEAVASLPAPARDALAAGDVDAALHYSVRSATILGRLAAGAGLADRFAALRHLCLSPAIAEALRQVAGADLRPAVASSPSEVALLALLDADQAPAGRRPGSHPSRNRC